MTCPRCGADAPDGARFCPTCGESLSSAHQREERKSVSILFVDQVGSTARADGADPEDVRDRNRAADALSDSIAIIDDLCSLLEVSDPRQARDRADRP